MDRVCSNPDCSIDISHKEYRSKYCSRSCAARVNNKKYIKRPRAGNEFCLRCNRSLIGINGRKYCSHDCRWRHGKEIYISAWMRGENTGSYANYSLSSTIREYLVESANYHCQSPTCAVPGGWSVPNPVTGNVILTVDHIDGNWKNNAVDNLIVLCYSCHTLTPTFGALNRGNPLVEISRRQNEGRSTL